MSEVLPLLYLHGLFSGDFGPALEQFLGSGAGLSATTITRLTAQWQDEAAAFGRRDLSGTDYVYVWVDGIQLKVRLEQTKLCLLVMIDVRADGRKELVAITDGYRESTESSNALAKVRPAISLMSAPAANALAEPVMMIAPMPGSLSNSIAALVTSFITWVFSALSAFGRFRVMVPTRASRSTRKVS